MTLLLTFLIHTVAILGLNASGLGYDFLSYITAQIATLISVGVAEVWRAR